MPDDVRTREEHLEWAKGRALEYLQDGEVVEAIKSLSSDFLKHSGTKNLVIEVGRKSLEGSSEMAIREYIEALK